MTFEIFRYVCISVRQWRRYLEYKNQLLKDKNLNAHVLPAQQYIWRLKRWNRKQAQRAGGIKSELAILQQRPTLSKLSNGVLDVA